jgi:hypothetical protein
MVSDRDGDGGQGSAVGNAPALRAYGGGREARLEDRPESARAGGARRDSGDVRAPAAHEYAGVRGAQ